MMFVLLLSFLNFIVFTNYRAVTFFVDLKRKAKELVFEYSIQTSQPQNTENLETEVKKKTEIDWPADKTE